MANMTTLTAPAEDNQADSAMARNHNNDDEGENTTSDPDARHHDGHTIAAMLGRAKDDNVCVYKYDTPYDTTTLEMKLEGDLVECVLKYHERDQIQTSRVPCFDLIRLIDTCRQHNTCLFTALFIDPEYYQPLEEEIDGATEADEMDVIFKTRGGTAYIRFISFDHQDVTPEEFWLQVDQSCLEYTTLGVNLE